MLFERLIKDKRKSKNVSKAKWFRFNRFSIKQWLFISLVFTITSFLIFSHFMPNSTLHGLIRIPPKVKYKCHSQEEPMRASLHRPSPNSHISKLQLRLDPKVLVFVETQYSKLGKHLIEILESIRVKFKVEIVGKSLPLLTNQEKGRFAVIIFENFDKYLNMNKWNRELIDKYCRQYSVGIVGMVQSNEEKISGIRLNGFPLHVDTGVAIKDYRLNPSSPVLRITRAGEVHFGNLPGNDWVVFYSNHTTYQPLGQAFLQYDINSYINEDIDYNYNFVNKKQLVSTVIQDNGLYDGIQRVLFGNGLSFWIHKLLLLDSLSFLSHGKLILPLQRYVLIDIDDIFVGEKGTRMKRSDVFELLESQRRLSLLIPGFRFNLGFSGKYYHKGYADEDYGDDLLLENGDKFWWFCHMYSHTQPHLYNNITVLENEMKTNRDFAQSHNIPINSGYSIAPHHSGVYPVHEPLYDAWKHISNVRVTSTEEYPHLRPARLRRGFIHRGIMVLPRQTCGLYTHTIFIDKYPGGRHKLENSIRGGELFYSFIFNPINVFMTHLSNYGNDRLAVYTFESVIRFVQCWTHLRLYTLPPLQLATKYFQLYPEESDPIWMNPCNDKRHLAIWSSTKSCDQLPKFLVIGPQKTGSTALYTFLSMHPTIVSNYPSPETFEEIQFFNGKNYYKGLDWYSNFFPVPKNSSPSYLFEKSATYFDAELVPMRAHALLPTAKVVAILISPIKRAYSWYHHIRAHKGSTALNFSFYDVITANDKSPKLLRELRNRCLNPGTYAQHLERWLTYYSPQQLMIIDGEELKADPVSVMNRLQLFLKIEPYFDYKQHLRFDPKKGFFCQVIHMNSTKCLGRSKGRVYPPMESKAQKFLRTFYLSHNIALSKLLTRLHHSIPQWLEEDLSTGYT